jgi:hypothetical protein
MKQGPSTSTPLLCCAAALVATAAAGAATQTSPARRSESAARTTQKWVLGTTVVPRRVQHLLKRRAPGAAYVPTRLPTGYTYFSHENVGRTGFDLFFSCCADFHPPLIGFDAVLIKRSEPCDQGSAAKVFRIDGVVVAWNAGHNDQQAWRCIRRDGTRLLLTVTAAASRDVGTSWRKPRQLAAMVASARPIR